MVPITIWFPLCRAGEIVSLEWDWIKGKRILLPDSKSGPRTVWLSSAARAVIDAIPRYGDDCRLLFPSRPPDRPTTMVPYHWDRIRREAGLDGLRLHDLRHSCAAYPVNLLFLIELFSRYKFRNRLITGFDRIPVVACRIRPTESACERGKRGYPFGRRGMVYRTLLGPSGASGGSAMASLQS